MTIAEQIEALRAKYPKHNGRKCSLREIARGAGITSTYMSQIARGAIPSDTVLAAIAGFFGETIEYFKPPQSFGGVDTRIERLAVRFKSVAKQQEADAQLLIDLTLRQLEAIENGESIESEL